MFKVILSVVFIVVMTTAMLRLNTKAAINCCEPGDPSTCAPGMDVVRFMCYPSYVACISSDCYSY